MVSFVDMMSNDRWSDADISNRCCALKEGQVSSVRENELKTIMLGHISGMRVATHDELVEISLVKRLTEEAADLGRAARADMVLLADVMAYEAAMRDAQSAHDAAVARNESLPEGSPPESVPALVQSPQADDPIYEVWTMRNQRGVTA